MANRSITVTLRANVQDFKSQFDAATRAAEETARATEQSAKRADTAMGRMVQSAQENREAWDTAGTSLTAFGAATLGGLGLATKAALDWESAWAGVTKTVDGSSSQMAALEGELRNMATTLPATHQEIAAVAESAGALGIAREDISSFTRTMIDLGETTNLTADEAATAIAQMTNVMQTSSADTDNLASALVALGNDGASTEAEILNLAQRLSGTAAVIGASEQDVLALSSTLASVGISAEMGGGALSRVMQDINTAVLDGGESLAGFAEIAGVSAEEFAAAWQESPVHAIDLFTQGLGRVNAEGGNAVGMLAELGIRSTEETRALLSLAGAGDLLANSLETSNTAWEESTALAEEAAKRYETAEARISIAMNSLIDAGIDIGGVMLPALAGLAERVGDVAGAFSNLPNPVQGAVGALSGIAGAGALAAGGFLLVFPRAMETISAFRTLREDMPGVASGLGRVGRAAAVAAGSIAALSVVSSITESMRDGAERSELLAVQLMNLSSSGDVATETINDLVASTVPFGVSVRGVGDALSLIDTDPVSAGIEGLTKAVLGVPTTVDVATESLGSLDGALVQLVNGGNLDQFSEAFRAAVEDAEAYGYTAEDLIAQMPALREALTPVATEMGLQADNATLARIAMEGLTPEMFEAASGMDDAAGAAAGFEEGLSGAEQAAVDAAAATDDYYSSLRDLADEFITAERAAMDYADSLEETEKAARENGKAWEDGTEAADANKRALLDLAEQALATADSLSAEGKSGTFLQQAREDLIEVATEMTGSREEAERYVDQLLGTPEEIETIVKLETEQAKADWAALWDELGYNPPEVPVGADTSSAEDEVGTWTGLVSDQPPTDVPVGADTSGAQEEVTIWGSQVGDVPAKVYVQADLYGMEATMEAFYAEMQEQDWEIEINGETVGAEEALGILLEEVNNGEGSVTINGMTFPADTSLMALIEAINMSEGEVTIEGNNAPAKSETDEAKAHADGTTGTMDVDGDNSGAVSATESAEAHADGTTGTIDVDANTWGANAAINAAARTRTAYINVVARRVGGSAYSVASSAFRAGGGPVFGPGTETSDSINARLSHNEHVWAAREVKAAGGHGALANIRAQVLSGAKTIHLATGGAADGSVRAVQYAPPYRQAPQAQPGLGSLNVYPQVAPEADPTVFGRRVGESLGHLLEGVRS